MRACAHSEASVFPHTDAHGSRRAASTASADTVLALHAVTSWPQEVVRNLGKARKQYVGNSVWVGDTGYRERVEGSWARLREREAWGDDAGIASCTCVIV